MPAPRGGAAGIEGGIRPAGTQEESDGDMTASKQRTLAASISFAGKGLHTAAESRITIHPGEPNTGFRVRTQGKEARILPVNAEGSRHRTVVTVDGTEVHTVEHVLAALYGMGVDNAVLEVEGGEVPGLDGSATVYAEKVKEAGLVGQAADARVFAPVQPIAAAFAGSSITAFPTKDRAFRVTYILDYPESRLAQGTVEMTITPEAVFRELAPCRTFVMKCHAEKLLQAGLGQGANTENTLVLDGDTVVDNTLRFPDECARHKALDVVGDLATLGRRLQMHVVAYKSGHALNLELARRLRLEILRVENPRGLLDIRQIERTLPHRYPFLLVDRVLEIEPGRRILAYKNLTRNEDFFNGHFPGQPIMPGVLQIEALAQAGGVLMMGEHANRGKLAVLMGIDDVKFRRPVVPGDQLMMEIIFEKVKGRIGVVYAKGQVDGEVTTECRIKFALVDPDQYT